MSWNPCLGLERFASHSDYILAKNVTAYVSIGTGSLANAGDHFSPSLFVFLPSHLIDFGGKNGEQK